MRKYILPFVIVGLLAAFWAYAQNKTDYTKKDEQLVAKIIADVLENGHYSPNKLDDNISSFAFDDYLEKLDFNKLYFLQSDIDQFKKYRTELDDEVKNLDFKFFHEVIKQFNKRLDESEELYKKILAKPFDFEKNESIELDGEKRSYFKSNAEREEYWRLYLKYLTMLRLANKIEKQEKDLAKPNDSIKVVEKTKTELEIEARKQVLKNMNTRFERRREIDDEDQFAIFINSIAAAFGPHTEYFPPQEKENFDMRMTGRLEGIGAQLTKENEYIKVVEIVPGSASWKQGELKANDLIIKVAQKGEEPVDIVDAAMKEAISLIRGPKGTEVTLTVQKPNGEIKEIPIIRDVVIQEETYAKSALIESKTHQNKIGYIYLPSFYSTFGEKDGRRSADDIKNELNRLKKENVSGIILDLRNNGGGSLQDAIDMTGHFIEKGPVVQVKDETRPPRVYSDRDKEIVYDGPVIVMINSFSASASEILAAALEDYNRAIIVGTPSFGKGTVQTMIDLNRYVNPDMIPDKPLGSLKFTIQQFYRVNGASTQLKGVEPHIYLPDEYSYMETGIKSLKNPLPWDKIDAAKYEKCNYNYDIKSLKKNSAKRIKKDEIFSALENRNAKYKKDREATLVSTNIEAELAERKVRKQENKEFTSLIKPDDNFEFISLQEFNPADEADVIADKKENWQKQLSKDYYLHEVIFIMEDMIKS